MTGLMIEGALLSGFFNVIFDRIVSKEVVDFLRGKRVVAELLFELKTRLGSANKLLSDAEEKQLGDQEVKKWLDELRDVVYEADYLLDKINTEALRRKVEENVEFLSLTSRFLNFIPNFVGTFENSVKFEVTEIIRKLKLLLDQTSYLGLKDHHNRVRVSHGRLLSPLIEESDVCGRKVEREAIAKLLLKDDFAGGKIKVIPIVGMGGIGKTTLARLVYNDSEVQEHFDLKAWVIVSENFDVARITKTILETVLESHPSTEDPNKLQSDLKNALRGKKFLFVLDDVWSENYDLWDVLRSSFESGEPGSKIIVTTRSKVVASNMGNVAESYDLQTISDDDCWILFAKHVGFGSSDSSQNSDLKVIGIEIVKKCKGLPLAVKSVAGVLRSVFDPDEWRRILHSDIWELQNTNILPALWLSYKFLPPNLKRCFAYFSMFPKDYEFDQEEREKIILMWMADGLLQDEKGKRMEDVGTEYFNALISRSFFQRSSRSVSTFLMHDLLHDLAIRISGELSLTLGEYNNKKKNDLPKINAKTRHLLYWKNSKDRSMGFDGLSEAKCLRTFLAIPLSKNSSSISSSSALIENALSQLFPSGGGRLRVLSLSSSALSQLPDSFGILKHLRYLNLSCTEIENVPDSVCLLYNLQTLLVSHCKKLTHLPANTCNLINLCHLDVDKTPLKEMPPKMENLKNLQELSDFVLGKNDGNRMKELGELQLLHGRLRISGLENPEVFWDFSQANLKSKEFLTSLVLSWEGETEDSRKERELLSELRPHPNLKELEINGFRGTIFPNWVGNNSSHGMTRVFLSKCKNCVMLPSFGQLPSLKVLQIKEMEELVNIGDEFCGAEDSSTKPFPSLEILSLDGLLMWKEWSFSRRTVFETGRFPSLKHLHLEFCRRINIGLPNGFFPSLKSVRIVGCRSMEAVFPTSRVPIEASFPSLESVQIWRCPRLEFFSKKGLPCSLRKLEIHDDCEMLFANRAMWGLQRLTSLERLELSGCRQAIDSFPEEGLLPSNLTRLRLDSFRSLKSLNGRGFRSLTSLQQLSISECEQLENLPEEGLPSSLSYLRIVLCQFLSQRCQRDIGEDWPKIQHIPVIIINREEI